MHGRTTTRAVALALSVVVLGGCSGGDGATPSEADLMNPGKGPLGKLLGLGESSASQAAKHLALEQAIADCMKDEGWEYRPRAEPVGATFAEEYDEQMADPVAYGERYGYGVVRTWESLAEAENQPSQPNDPNEAYLATLTDGEVRAWWTALSGLSEAAFDAAADGEPPPLDEQGCYGKAQALVHGDSPAQDPAVEEALIDALQHIGDDPAMKAATERWAACMRRQDPSYRWATSDDIVLDLSARIEEATAVDEVDDAAIEALRQEEITIWAADHACLVEADVHQVRREVEQRLADDLVAQFPSLADG